VDVKGEVSFVTGEVNLWCARA